MSGFAFVCPACRTPLQVVSAEEQRCTAEGVSYHRVDGIWRFLPPDGLAYFDRFIREYETVRRAEGRGSTGSSYYRALPFQDLTGRHSDNWSIRTRSFQELRSLLLPELETERGQPLKILDLGAGNGWLSYRMALRGHQVAAVDLLDDALDGLGAWVHYDAEFTPVQAEFDRLPFDSGQMDLVLFNASFHYATDYVKTLAEAFRVLRPEGRVAIVDSPVYRDQRSGARMVQEREAQFQQDYGFPSNAIPSENYLTYHRLEQLADTLHLHWRILKPFYGWRWALRPWRARLRGRREPAQFMVIVGQQIRDTKTGGWMR